MFDMIFNIMSTMYLKIDCSCGRPFEFALFVSDVDFLQRRPVLPVQSQDVPQVWIDRVHALPDAVSKEVDGDVTLVNMQCEYFTTQVLKAKGALKHKLFGNLSIAEQVGSNARNRKYHTYTIDAMKSTSILAAFESTTYFPVGRKKQGGAQSSLHWEHVEQAARFAVVAGHWLTWLKKNNTATV